jgi:hypothetical protein
MPTTPNFMGTQVNFGPDAEKQLEIQRRMQLAQALQGQGMEPLKSETAPGGWAVPIHPLQGIAKLAQSYVGGMQAKKGQELAGQLQRDTQERSGADTNLLAQALLGRQAQPAGMSEDAAGNVTPTDAVPAMSGPQAISRAIPMMGPQMQPVALQALMGSQQREDAQEHQRAQLAGQQAAAAQAASEGRAARAHEFGLAETGRNERAAASLTAAEQRDRARAADTKGLQQMILAARAQQPQQQRAPIAVMGEDGKTPVYVPADQAAGRQPWSPSMAGRDRPMTATAQKELIETEEGIQGGQAALSLFKQARDLNDKAMGFTGAGALASAGSILPSAIRPGTVEATQNLDNILQTAALPQLKAIFGGMPTEGERKILLDVQGSSSKPPAVRKEIFARAEKAINARLKFGQEKVKRLREGTYFSGEGLPSIQMDDGGGAPGVPQGIDPALWAAMTPQEQAAFR